MRQDEGGERPFVDAALARLLAYQEALALAALTRATVRRWAHGGRHDLADQMTGAAESVYANIAEGHGHASRAEKARYFGYAWSSFAELRAHLDHAAATRLLSRADARELRTRCTRVGLLLSGLRRSVSRPAGHPPC